MVVGHIVHGVPKTEFHIGEKRNLFFLVGIIGQRYTADLTAVLYGNKDQILCFQTIFLRGKTGIAQAVAALIGVQLGFRGLPTGVPDGIAVLDIEIVAVAVQRHGIVAVTGQAEQLGVFIKAVSSGSIGNQRKEAIHSQIIDPGKGRFRGLDDIFFICIVKMSKLHVFNLLSVSEND